MLRPFRTDSRPRSTPVALVLVLVAVTTGSAGLGFAASEVPGAIVAGPTTGQDDWLPAEDRRELDLMLRRGELEEALATLTELLDEVPDDAPVRLQLARGLRLSGRYDEALAEARRALGELTAPDGPRGVVDVVRAGVWESADLLLALGRADEALETLAVGVEFAGDDALDPREVWARGRALLDVGRRDEALEAFRAGGDAARRDDWRRLLAQARCLRALGRIEDAAEVLVAADRSARGDDGVEPDVLVELGEVYFEFYGEVDDAVGNAHSPRELYDEALDLAPGHEGALLGLFRLYRFNWNRSARNPAEILDELFERNPRSLEGRLTAASAALDDGDLRKARELIGALEEQAAGRRAVRTQRAALAWIEHDRERARALLDELVAVDPADSAPAREVGRHLLELYRFAEGLPFLEKAVERDPQDHRALRELGRAQANTGDEDAARASLARAVEAARGRRDAWRDNTLLVLERMHESLIEHETPNLTFAWLPDAAFVFETYLEPFYREAREELSARYGFTPDPVRIEVFRRWNDFSVRSTGFEGFPALGVCFGPVVTAVSPLARELRGGFSWARTSYHEFTHVIHLGLSHNRCPRWVTEGLATWEEGRRNPAWWRNYRRDLVDARANDELIPVRRLNNAFRGSRVLFAYYQSGLLCKLLVEEHGFPSLVRLLEAFDRGADLDEALQEVFATTPEALDERFAAYVDGMTSELAIEPRWSRRSTFKRRFALARRAPTDEAERLLWQDEWAKVGWGDLGAGRRVDAEEVLRLVESAGSLPPRALFLKGEIALERSDEQGAREAFEAALASGGEDFRARMALSALAMGDGDDERAREHLAAAERAFPGFDDAGLSAELRMADHLERQGDRDDAMAARQRWLAYNAGDDSVRLMVARWLAEVGRHEEAVVLFSEANEVDPFRRSLHLDWGRSLLALGRFEECLRESRVGLRIPWELEREAQGMFGSVPDGGASAPTADWEAMRIPLLELQVQALAELGPEDELRGAAERLVELEPGNPLAVETLERLQ